MPGDGTTDERAALLEAVAVAFATAPTITDIMDALVRSLAPALCDACEVVLVRDGDTFERVAAGPGAFAARRDIPIPPIPDHPVRTVSETGKPMVLRRSVPAEAPLFGPPEQPLTAANLGMESAVLAPMHARHRVVGVLVGALGPSGREWHAGDDGFLTSIATLAGLAIEAIELREEADEANRRLEALLERQAHIARTLQSGLLPRVLPDIPGVELSAHYWPAAEDLEVSGDFYDVFPLGGTRWGLLVGDVCGKGVEAAAATATARHTARAAA